MPIGHYNFTGLTPAQKVLLTSGGWSIGCGRVQPSPRTVAKLIDRGLIEVVRVEERTPIGTMTVLEYYVPWPVGSAWRASRPSRTLAAPPATPRRPADGRAAPRPNRRRA